MDQRKTHYKYLVQILTRLIALPSTDSNEDKTLGAIIGMLKKMSGDTLYQSSQDQQPTPQQGAVAPTTNTQDFNNTLQQAYQEADQAMKQKNQFSEMIKNNQMAQRGQV